MADEKEKPKTTEEKSQDEGQAKAAKVGVPEAVRITPAEDDVIAYGEPVDGSSGKTGS